MADQVRGPAMIAATSMLRPPPARVGKISDKIVLPRSVEVKKLFAAVSGLVLVLALWGVLWGPLFGYSFRSMLFALVIGAGLGVAFVTISPLRGETTLKWLELQLTARRGNRVVIGGQEVKAYLGIAPLNYTAAGPVRLLPGAVDVPAGTVDERGVPIPAEEVRRQKLEAVGGRVSAPSQAEGFATLSSLGTEVLPNSKYENRPAGSGSPVAPPHPGSPGTPVFPAPAGSAAPQPGVPAPGVAAEFEDPFAKPGKKLPKNRK